MKQAKQKFITIVDEEGITNKAGIIHEWHDDYNITVEWIPFIEIAIMSMFGKEPDNNPIISERCEDVDLQKLSEGSYKLHFTWLTVNGAYVRDFNEMKVR